MKRWLFLIALGVGLGIWFGVMQRGIDDEHRSTPRPVSPAPEIHAERARPSRAEVVHALEGLFRQARLVVEVLEERDTLVIWAKPGQCDRKALTDLRGSLSAIELDPRVAGFTAMRCAGQTANAVLDL